MSNISVRQSEAAAPEHHFRGSSRNSLVSRPTSPKTQFTSAEAYSTFARRVDSALISAVDVSANASGSEQGKATGKRGKTPPTNVTLRDGSAYYAYPIGKILGLRSGAGTPEPGESDTRPGDDRLLPARLWRLAGGMSRPPTVGWRHRHKHRVKRPGDAGTLGKMMGVREWKDSSWKWTAREQKIEEKWDKRTEAIEERKRSKEQKGGERGEKACWMGSLVR